MVPTDFRFLYTNKRLGTISDYFLSMQDHVASCCSASPNSVSYMDSQLLLLLEAPKDVIFFLFLFLICCQNTELLKWRLVARTRWLVSWSWSWSWSCIMDCDQPYHAIPLLVRSLGTNQRQTAQSLIRSQEPGCQKQPNPTLKCWGGNVLRKIPQHHMMITLMILVWLTLLIPKCQGYH